MDDFSDYDPGFRRGVFDKCNGQPERYSRDSIQDDLFIAAYFDGYDNNEVRINGRLVHIVMEDGKAH